MQKKQSKFFIKFYTPIQKMLDGLDVWYAKRIDWAVRHRWTVIIACFSFFGASLFCFPLIKSEFFPANDNGRVGITIELPIGTRVEIARELSLGLTKKWMERYGDDINACNFRVGQADEDNTFAAIQSNGSHIISFNISLVPSDQRERKLDAICDEMRMDLKQIPEIAKYVVNMGGGSGGMGGQSMASFEIYGYDMAATDKLSNALADSLRAWENVTQVNISRSDYQPEYQVEFDREKLAMHGLNLSTAATYLRNRYNGSLATYFREDGDEYDVRVRYEPTSRTSIEDIENIVLYTNSGKGVRVKDLGHIVLV